MRTKTKPSADDVQQSSTVADIDDDALQQAGAMLGTESPRDTVNEALREVIRRRQVREYVALMKRMAAETEEVDDPRSQAW
jgi:Arc/MetJ family transcription regulator